MEAEERKEAHILTSLNHASQLLIKQEPIEEIDTKYNVVPLETNVSVQSSVKTEAGCVSQIKSDDCLVDMSKSVLLNCIKKEEEIKLENGVTTAGHMELYVESYGELKYEVDVAPNALECEQGLSANIADQPVLKSQMDDKHISDDIAKSSDKTFACDKCSYRGKSKRDLYCHKHEAHSNRPFRICHLCSYKTQVNQRFRVHMMRHAKRRKHLELFKCPDCDSEFLLGTLFVQHTSTKHGKSQPFHCERCDRKFSSVRKFTKHKRLSHPQKVFRCDSAGCEKIFKSENSLSRHIKIHNDDFHCDVCDKTLSNRKALLRHLRWIHQPQQNIVFYCDFPGCSKFFVTPSSLGNHKRIHDVPAYNCKNCKKRFKTEGHFSKHKCVRKKKSLYVAEKQTCEECGIVLSSKGNLSNHKRSKKCSGTLTSIEDKTCTGCNELFPTKAFLLRHKTHCVFC